MLKRVVMVWEAPVRILHWIHFFSIAVLALTGLYIGAPFIDADDIGGVYVMGTVRFIHFVAAFVFVLGFLVRGYWFVAGNRYEHWTAWLPVNKQRWRELWRMQRYYLFLLPHRPRYIGVNPIAGLTYMVLGVLIVVQAITGFALFGLPFASGLWRGAFGWLITLFGAQPVRLVHHVLLWFFVTFFIAHLYLGVLDDVEEHSGEFVSIISGEKFEPMGQESE
jgi:Ni/Fe-hydrogenase 1 B-type cytochrome subunit